MALKLLLFVYLIYASVTPVAAEEQQTVRIGLTREVSTAPLLVTIAAGYFSAEGLTPQLTFLDSDDSVAAAVSSGKLDIGATGLSPNFFGFAAAHTLKIIASRSIERAGFPMYALVIGEKGHTFGLRGLRALAHHRIGISRRDFGAYYALSNIASRFGLDFASLEGRSFASHSEEIYSLSHSAIDAVLLPFATAIRVSSKRTSMLVLSDFGSRQEGVLFTTAATIDTRREFAERFVRAYQRGTAEYQLNFLEYDDDGDFIPGQRYTEYLDYVAHKIKVRPEILARTKTYCDPHSSLDVRDIEQQVRFWQYQGRLDKQIKPASLVDISLLQGQSAGAP